MKLYNITFSPTGGTRKAAALLIGGLEGEVCQVDLTDSRLDPGSVQLAEEDVAVISVPSYGGRVPAVAVERLTALKGGGARAVLVCVYGNRAYEDTLVELEDAAKRQGSGSSRRWPPSRSTLSRGSSPPAGPTNRTRSSWPDLPARSGIRSPRAAALNPPSPATAPTKSRAAPA